MYELFRRFASRPLLTLSVFGGVALSFGISYSIYRLVDRFNRQNDKLMAKLFSLDSEVLILRETIDKINQNVSLKIMKDQNNHASNHISECNSSDDYEDYFDLSSDEFSDSNLVFSSKNPSLTSFSSYHSAKSQEIDRKERIFNELDNYVLFHQKTPSMIRNASEKSIRICWKYRCSPQFSRDPNFLWRFGRSCYYAAFHCPDCLSSDQNVIQDNITKGDHIPESKSDFILMGNSILKACQELYEEVENFTIDVNFYRWFIMLLGVLAEISPVADRIKFGHEFKHWLDKAIDKYPAEYDFFLFRGRWSLAVYNLTWIERKLAYTLFGGKFPNADIKDAEIDFRKSLELSHRKCFRSSYFIGVCMQSQSSKYSNEEIASAYQLTNKIFQEQSFELELDEDSRSIRDELTKKLKDYSRYMTNNNS